MIYKADLANGEEFTFNEVATILTADTASTARATVRQMQHESRRAVAELNQRFFTVLSQKIVGVGRKPNLSPEAVPPWKRLNETYKKRKIASGRSGKFFSYDGNLKEMLETANTRRMFGREVVRVKQAFGRVSKQDIDMTLVPTKRNYVFSKNGSIGFINKTGRFTPDRYARFFEEATLEIIPFPAILNKSDEAILKDVVKAKNFDMYVRLSNRRGMQNRKVIGPYARWWMRTKIATEVEKIVYKLNPLPTIGPRSSNANLMSGGWTI